MTTEEFLSLRGVTDVRVTGELAKALRVSDDDELVLVGDDGADAALATREQYENFELALAHSYAGGPVIRFGIVVGNISDIVLDGAAS